MPPKRVAIIGAGPSGLTAIKCCKEEGLEPICYERNGDPGGLWRYHDEDIEGVASVMKTTIINTSKERSAFSDFPPPKEFANYMHNSHLYEYFMMYATTFDLLQHIRYYFEVIRVQPSKDFDSTGRWNVTVRNTQTSALTSEDYDGVMVCVGHHVYPNVPTFPGQEKFKGTITHTHSIKSCDHFKGKKVVVIGIGNSGVDAAVDCTFVSSKVYLSSRRGSWILTRVGANGLPFDIAFSSRKKEFLFSVLSYNTICDYLEAAANKMFDHETYKLKPNHRIFSAHPTINDALPCCILSGKIVIKGDIERLEENGVVFDGEESVTEIDSIILATGYHLKFPFLDSNIISTKENRVHLYKYSFPPGLKHPTLAMIGLIQPLGAIFPISEMQSRLFARILTGKVNLPSVKEMEKDIFRKNEANAKRYVASSRHTIQVDWLPFMDELAEMIGVKPNLIKLAITDPKLFLYCFTGPCLPYQFRLQGPHKWHGAREAIISYEERVLAPLNPKAKKESKNCNTIIFKSFLFVILAASIFYGRKYFNMIEINGISFF